MFGDREERSGTGLWLLAAGAAVGIGAVLWFGLRRGKPAELQPAGASDDTEAQVIQALRRDAVLRGRGIDVSSIAPGIIELTGSVETEDEAHHAVDIVQAVTGVRTVLNRLDLAEFEQRLNRKRTTTGTGAGMGGGSRWYGMGVGMGRRRQSASTDPAQRDDHVDLLEEAINPDPEEIVADLNEERTEAR